MPDDKPSKDSSIPPPLDPFPTYQTPYPRSNTDHENPFIQFRRFADEQFSSFFQGIPHLFGFQSKDVDDLMRRRHELEEGWRKQLEQEMEEMRHEIEKSRTTALKAMEDAWARSTEQTAKATDSKDQTAWWTRGNAAKCPALNGQEPQKNANKCPALYDEAGQPKTELDLYDRSSPAKPESTGVHQEVKDVSKPTEGDWFEWLTPGDLKSRGKAIGSNKNVTEEGPHTPATRYSMFGVRHMSPFDNPDHTIPWLMLSPYSPIYLCNPSQSRLFRLRIQDSEDAPLQISRPRFFERWYSEVDEKLARQLPWADAFEDLISLQQTGKMVDRNYSTLRTPSTWIHDMVSRGSLGNRWGFNEDGFLVKRSYGTKAVDSGTTKKDRCSWRKERGWGPWKRFEGPKELSPEEDQEKQADSLDTLVDEIPEPIARSPLFGGLLSAADSIVSAVEQSFEDALYRKNDQTVDTPAGSSEPDETVSGHQEEPESTPYTSLAGPSSYSYESNSSSSYSSSSDQEPKSIISTLTSTVTRTLPDGSVETKRVLKRRFADGTEESNESTEVKNDQSRLTPQVTNVTDKETQTRPPNESRRIEDDQQQQLEQQNQDKLRRTYGEGFSDKQDEGQDQQTFNMPRGNPYQESFQGHKWNLEQQHKDKLQELRAREQERIQEPDSPPQSEPQQADRRRGGGWFWTR